jgi:hypothetical protein
MRHFKGLNEYYLPTLKTSAYFTFMETLIEDFQNAFPVSVYGFTYYGHVAFYWKLPTKEIDSTPVEIPTSTLLKLLYPNTKFYSNTYGPYRLFVE